MRCWNDFACLDILTGYSKPDNVSRFGSNPVNVYITEFKERQLCLFSVALGVVFLGERALIELSASP